MATSWQPAPSSALRMAPTCPSIIPLGATTSAPASACTTAVRAYSAMVASLSTEPSARTTPQCPWSVYSSRQRSARRTSESPTSSRRSRRASCTMPLGFHASEPSASLWTGMPNRITPGMPRSASSRTSLRNDSRVCWTTPGSDGTGAGASMPSRTNKGATRSSTVTRASATSLRNACVRRSLRRRRAGNAMPRW